MLPQTSQPGAGDPNSGTFILRQQAFYLLSHSPKLLNYEISKVLSSLCSGQLFMTGSDEDRHCPGRLYQNITPQTACKELTSNLLCREDSSPQKKRFGCGRRGQQPWEANFSYPWLIGNHEA